MVQNNYPHVLSSMLQLLLHLIGDYCTQTDWMANNKAKCSMAAAWHAVIYAVPFAAAPALLNSFQLWLTTRTGCEYEPFDTCNQTAYAVIALTHFIIDRFRLARYGVFAKNWVTDWSLRWNDCSATGYPPSTPAWMAVWMTIITDNTLHLTINFLALRYA